MDKISSYSSPKALGHRLVADVLDGAVTVQEKVDGSQISFANADGVLLVKSRNVQMKDGENKMFNKAFEHLKTVLHLMPDGLIFRGEFLSKLKHNTLVYDRAPDGWIVLFDVEKEGRYYMEQSIVEGFAAQLGLDYAPVVFEGDGGTISMADFELWMKVTKPVLGGEYIEGLVIKNYDRWLNDKVMMAKLVSKDFQERHQGDWKERNPGAMEAIKASINREAIWRKAIVHMKEEGKLLGEPKDIGMLMKEIKIDFIAENGEDIKLELYKKFIGEITKYVGQGFPEFYKRILADGSMPNQELTPCTCDVCRAGGECPDREMR